MNFDLGKFINYWIPVIAWVCFVFMMSTGTFSSQNTLPIIKAVLRFLFPRISHQELSLIHTIIRKAAHVIEYSLVGFLMFRALRSDSEARWNWRWSFWAVTFVIFWAVTDEIHQSFVPSRTASAVDVGFDTAGGILGQILSISLYRRKKHTPIASQEIPLSTK